MRRPTRSPRLATLCVQGGTAASTRDNNHRISSARGLLELRANRDWHPLDAILLPVAFSGYRRRWGRQASSSVTTWPSQGAISACDHSAFSAAIAQPRSASRHGRHGTTSAQDRAHGASVHRLRHVMAGWHARKIFPTLPRREAGGSCRPLDDYSSPKRFIDLPNGSTAALNSCYDLFGTADIGTAAVPAGLPFAPSSSPQPD